MTTYVGHTRCKHLEGLQEVRQIKTVRDENMVEIQGVEARRAYRYRQDQPLITSVQAMREVRWKCYSRRPDKMMQLGVSH